MQKIELLLDAEKQVFFNNLKKGHNELVVPLIKWTAYIQENPRFKPEDIPDFVISGAYVITDREWFDALIRELGFLFYAPKRLVKEQGGFWFAEKLEPKKNMPQHDIFDVGLQQPGSFRSKQ